MDRAVKDISLGCYGVSTSKVLLQYVTAPALFCQRGHTIKKTLFSPEEKHCHWPPLTLRCSHYIRQVEINILFPLSHPGAAQKKIGKVVFCFNSSGSWVLNPLEAISMCYTVGPETFLMYCVMIAASNTGWWFVLGHEGGDSQVIDNMHYHQP